MEIEVTKYNLIIFTVLCLMFTAIQSGDLYAKGGFSSGGSRGGFSSSRSFSGSRSSFSSRPTYQTRTTTTTRSSYTYGNPMVYSGLGTGYMYNNGFIQGLLIGHLLHPKGSIPYTGGGYGGNALVYPDGRVVNKDGYQVGTYNDGQFNPVEGGMVAKRMQVMERPITVTTWTIEDFVSILIMVVSFCILIVLFFPI